MNDADGRRIRSGDRLVGSYGIPPVRIEAIAKTALAHVIGNHNPKVISIKEFVKYTGATIRSR